MTLSILRREKVSEITGKPRSTLYGEIKNGLFTAPVKLSASASGWPAHEVEAILRARIAGKSDDDIRALVADLQQQRLQAA